MLRLGALSLILPPGYLLFLPTSLESTLLQTIVSVSLVWDLETKPWALLVFIPPGLALLLGQQTRQFSLGMLFCGVGVLYLE